MAHSRIKTFPCLPMITRRQIICFILSALLFSSCALLVDDQAQRIVCAKALADQAFRARNRRWDEEVRGLVEAASDYYEKAFGIRFVTQSSAAWPAQEKITSSAELVARLKGDFAARNYNE